MLFRSDLTENNSEDLALDLLKQAALMARKGCKNEVDRYPEGELQWIATTAFNKAVDLLSAGRLAEASEWIDGALELARYGDDNGVLHSYLTERRDLAMDRVRARAI